MEVGNEDTEGWGVTLPPLPLVHTASHHGGRNKDTEGWGVTLPIYIERESRSDPVCCPQGEQRL